MRAVAATGLARLYTDKAVSAAGAPRAVDLAAEQADLTFRRRRAAEGNDVRGEGGASAPTGMQLDDGDLLPQSDAMAAAMGDQ